MNKLKIFSLLFLLLGCLTIVKAQDETPSDAPAANQTKRPGLLAQLNLSRDQIRQIREINQQNRPQIREANQRLKEANRNLDSAIYGDTADDADIQSKIKAVHAAHAEAIRLRAQTEYAVRKILNPDQLARFREIRQQSLAEKENIPRLRNTQVNTPNRALRNRLRNNRPLN